jgi:integrase
MAEVLRPYLKVRNQEGISAPSIPLFSFTEGHHIHPCTISQTFHHLLPALDLPKSPGISSPRVHDLRHSFAVGTLLRWYQEGLNPSTRLIHLSTFLGHVSPSSTAVYLTMTDELLAEANGRFERFAAFAIKEVS